GGFAFGGAPLGVGLGGGVVAQAGQRDGVQGAVELAVTVAVEPEAPRGAAAAAVCGDGGGAAEHGEGGLGADPAGVGPGAQDRGGGDRADPELGKQVGPPAADDGQDVLLVPGGLGAQGVGALGQVVQHPGGG